MTQKNQATTAAADFEWDAIEGGNTDFTVSYPRFQWIHGEAKASGINKTGGLFVSADNYPNFEAEGFAAADFILRDGGEIKGFGASKANLAVIRMKKQWVKDETYNRQVPLVHALVAVQGCDDIVCISLRGASKALAFEKAFQAHQAQNVSLANRNKPASAQPMEPFALWFPLVAGPLTTVTSKDGKSKSTVTPPELFTPESNGLAYVRSLWVGGDNYRTFAAIWKETAAWQKAEIWEKRDADPHSSDTPEYSGGDGDPATPEMIDHLVSLCTAKGFDVRQLVMTITDGQTENVGTLSKAEVRHAIEQAKGA